MIIDATDAILGRISSYVAKKLLKNEDVHIINSEKIIITGNPKTIEKEYLERRQRGDPKKGPFFPKKPNMIVRRTIRGMLPKNRTGRKALGKLRVHIGVPENLEGDVKKFKNPRDIETRFIRIDKLAKKLGWSG